MTAGDDFSMRSFRVGRKKSLSVVVVKKSLSILVVKKSLSVGG